MERKSETTRNYTRVNSLTLISLSRSLMKHVLSNSHSEKLPGKSRPRSIPFLIKRDILRRKRYLIWSVSWSSFGLWTVIRYFASIKKQTNKKNVTIEPTLIFPLVDFGIREVWIDWTMHSCFHLQNMLMCLMVQHF